MQVGGCSIMTPSWGAGQGSAQSLKFQSLSGASKGLLHRLRLVQTGMPATTSPNAWSAHDETHWPSLRQGAWHAKSASLSQDPTSGMQRGGFVPNIVRQSPGFGFADAGETMAVNASAAVARTASRRFMVNSPCGNERPRLPEGSCTERRNVCGS